MSSSIIHVLGVPYEVVEDADDIEGGNEGECCPDEGKLKLKAGAPGRRWSKLRHEIGHAVSFESGLRDRLVSEFGVSYETAKRLEEAIVGHFVPAYCQTLENEGWLYPPTPPTPEDQPK